MRNRLWAQWQRENVVLPHGMRHDFPLERSDDKLQFAGWIDCEIDELGVAVEVTRTHPALCVLHPDPRSTEWLGLIADVLVRLGDPASDGGDLLRGFIPALRQGAILLRGFGGFDDNVVGVDLYGQARTIDAIEASLRPA